jgi:transcription antitermination factor NusB
MTSRRIARELAVILLPQLPKDKAKLELIEVEDLASKAVAMLCDYGKENLAEVDALITKTSDELMTTEIEHPTNVRSIAQLLPVTLTTEQVKEQLANLKRALNLVTEAIDMPALALHSHPGKSEIKEFLIQLVNAYSEHRQEIDDFIRQAKAKWQIERMVSIDRDILRLACAEAFYMPDIPIAVVINEAVDLCHRFADDKAAKFINGILADLDKDAEYFRQHGTLPEKISVDDTAENLG